MNLYEFTGVCEHEWEWVDEFDADSRCVSTYEQCTECGAYSEVDFTTPEGYQLLQNKMTERGEWWKFRMWLHKTDHRFNNAVLVASIFHEDLTDLTEKVRLLTEYIETLEV